jgi:MFS family permease
VFVLEAVANSAITPFLGTYQVNELEFSMAFISELSIIVSLVQMVSVFLAGKLSMHLEHKTLLRIGFPIVAVSYLINIFTVPANGTYMYIIYSVVHTLGVAALSVSRTNILLEMIPRQNHVAAISLNAIATGILSFLTTLALSPVVSLVQKSGNTVFGISIYAQQLLSALAVLLYLILIVYYNLALIPEIDNKQNRVYPREE